MQIHFLTIFSKSSDAKFLYFFISEYMHDRKSKYHDVIAVQNHLVQPENNVYFVCKSISYPVKSG